MSKTQDTPKRLKLPKYINKTRFYRIEREAFPEEHYQNLTDIEAKRFVRKIIKHFQLPKTTLKFHGNRKRSGCADYATYEVSICHIPSIMLLCHELSHLVTQSGHTKRSLSTMEKLVLYARKKNYWKRVGV